MSYTVPFFQTLVSTYPTWTELETYLASVKVRVVGSDRHRILRLQATTAPGVSGWLRSVVWDTETNRPVCVAPPKAETGDVPTGSTTFSLVQDFLDGTMINAYQCLGSEPQIATRTQIGAQGTFYSEKTFAQMFAEASKMPFKAYISEPTDEKPATFVSFLLQHPHHRVVGRCHHPRLYVIHEGFVAKDGLVTIQEVPNGWPEHVATMAPSWHPMTGFQTQADLDSFFASLVTSHGWFWQGLVFKDGQGKRWKMRNPNYVYLRELRGPEASSEERFLRLRAHGKVMEYLKHFSEDRNLFWTFEQSLRAQTQCVYMAYVDVHKTRVKKLADLPKILQPFVFRLHAKFLESAAAGTKVSISMKETVELVNLSPLFEKRRLLTTPTVVMPIQEPLSQEVSQEALSQEALS